MPLVLISMEIASPLLTLKPLDIFAQNLVQIKTFTDDVQRTRMVFIGMEIVSAL